MAQQRVHLTPKRLERDFMAIKTEYYTTREDGVVLHRTYSDKGMMIERDGVRYSEAIDPAELGRRYKETDESIEKEDYYE